MAGLNLLPWREEAREESRKKFIMIAISSLAFGVLTVFGGYTWMQGNISYQESRNTRFKSEINSLDMTITKIKKLDATRKALLDRIEIIDTLQSTRPSIVHLFDEMVNALPKGLFLTKLEQSDGTVKIEGKAESNTRVSSYMKRLNASPWLKSSDLHKISIDNTKDKNRLRRFKLNVTQVIKVSSSDAEKGGQYGN
ncbi:MAG: PilN domain-containing protein [Gammaproteobacteria bacterium]|nr:PilN domain-containing protein [Gammaproteobacteria bacterium]